MSDLPQMLSGLRADTAQVTWPEGAAVRARGDRRTKRRWAAAAAAVSVAVAITGSALLTGGRPNSAPAGPAPMTPLPLDAIQSAPSGTIFAITHTCAPGQCSASTSRQYKLLRSTDLARSWTTVASLNGVAGGPNADIDLVVADDAALWVIDGTRLLGSSDGGKHWSRRDLAADRSSSTVGSLAGTTVWFADNDRVLRATGGGRPAPTAGQPAGSGPITSIAAISADGAIALRVQGSRKAWYRTADRGAHWSAATDPCAGLSYLNVSNAYLTAGREGGLWAVCFVAAGEPPDWQIATSDDGGHSWQTHPGGAPGGDDVVPVSSTVAWRTGGDADVYRTTDAGEHWTDVAHLPPGASIHGGFVRDANTALFVLSEIGTDRVTLRLTTDGGTTWTTLPFGR